MEHRAPPSTNIAATIFRDLRSQILKGMLKPSERLPGERELAAQYGTNRNTLREAVRMLEQARLVTVRHGQGVTVADFRKTGTMELLPPFLENTGNAAEIHALLEDILPARLLVLEFATRLAAKRASTDDISRLRDITELLIAAFERRDPVVIAHGFQRWLDALLDAGHSVAVRWIANPFLDAYRELLDRFPRIVDARAQLPAAFAGSGHDSGSRGRRKIDRRNTRILSPRRHHADARPGKLSPKGLEQQVEQVELK